MSEHRASANCCLLISVGGSPEPIIYSIDTNKPEKVIYFCSRDSRKEIRANIEPRLSHQLKDTQTITTPNEQSLYESVKVLIDELPDCLSDFGCDFKDLHADFTGGTKPMAAAIVLALADKGCPYSYVGGVGRDKEGLGVVLAGREQMLYTDNPWDALGRDALMLYAAHFNRCRFGSAQQVAQQAAARSDRLKPLFATLATLADGYGKWDNFDHKSASNLLSSCLTPLQSLPFLDVGQSLTQVFAHLLPATLEHLKQAKNDMLTLEGKSKESSDGRALLLDLLANAVRRAEREHRYDDAISRLYSVVEKSAKIQLKLMHGIDNSKVPLSVLSEGRDDLQEGLVRNADGSCKLPLYRSFALLAALCDPLGELYLQEEVELKKVLDIRNNSLLAHGFNPVTQATYDKLLVIALRFCKVERNDLPDFPWFAEQ